MEESNKQNISKKTTGIIPFVTEVTRYFMDFLETDFHKVRSPKRYIQNRNSSNLKVGIKLNKYKKFSSLVWKSIRSCFEDDLLKELKKGIHINPLPESLLKLIKEQIELISYEKINSLIELFEIELKITVVKNKSDPMIAISEGLDGISRVIREHFLKEFIDNIDEPLNRIKSSSLDSVYLIEEELNNILMQPFEDVVSSKINKLLLKKEVDETDLFQKIFNLHEIQNKFRSFFEGFASNDLFLEVSELVNNKNLLDKQEIYLYFCDISYKKATYPLFYIPMQIEKTLNGFSLTFDSLMYVNKKAIQFISQDYNSLTEKKGSIQSFLERIIYLSEKRQHLIGEIDAMLKDAATYYGLDPYIDLNNAELQISKGKEIEISNNCYLGLFDKSDESLINDYEDILLKLKLGDDSLASAFEVLVDDFITNNPISITSEIDADWDSKTTGEKLVFQSPVPLNEEQRRILSAISNQKSKYITVEGPPGTGKSHTITAIACYAILNGQSVLVLSDKTEALDVVEDKITQTMNKVRVDKNFQNPILRLGQAGNTYSKILSTTSIERIKEHYKAVRNDYKKIENTIDNSLLEVKAAIENSVKAYGKIKTSDIAEFLNLEKEVLNNKNYHIDLDELSQDQLSDDHLNIFRQEMLNLKHNFLDSTFPLKNLFEKIYHSNTSVKSFSDFIIFLKMLAEVKTSHYERQLIKEIEILSFEKIKVLEQFIEDTTKLRSKFLGYLFKRNKVETLISNLKRELPNNITEPHYKISELKQIAILFKNADNLKKTQEIATSFQIPSDFTETIHEFLMLDIEIPSISQLNKILENISTIQSYTKKYKKTSDKIALSDNNIFSYFHNQLTENTDLEFEKLIRYLCLKNDLKEYFNLIPQQNFNEQKSNIEDLITIKMTHTMDERVINFYENHRNDAKALAGVISKKQRFDRNSFDKLKSSFPCILASIRDFAEFIPLESEIFDIVIIDEASQVSIAQAFPALLRGKKIIVLGDKKQFSNIKANQARSDTNREYLNSLKSTFLKNVSNENTKLERLEKFNIKTSILEFFDRITNHNVMLKKHFRGYKELISYSSKYFYDDNLQAIKIRGKSVEEIIQFNLIEHDNRIEIIDNTNQLEIDSVFSEVEKIIANDIKSSIGIITPHTNQQKLLVERLSRHPSYEKLQKDHKLKIMTFDTCQGEERDTIIYSMVANPISDKLWGIFIKDRNSVDLEEGGKIKLQRLNVGFSRAKEKMIFIISKPIKEFKGSIGEALLHYERILTTAKSLPKIDSTDQRSPMEAKVLQWIQNTDFFIQNQSLIELHTQFPLGEYLKQLDKRYSHPEYVVDFFLIYKDGQKEHKIILEYDGFEFHFQNHSEINQFNYDVYYTEAHVYREKVLESYGYKFIRINRFNIGDNPEIILNQRILDLVKKKTKINH